MREHSRQVEGDSGRVADGRAMDIEARQRHAPPLAQCQLALHDVGRRRGYFGAQDSTEKLEDPEM